MVALLVLHCLLWSFWPKKLLEGRVLFGVSVLKNLAVG